MIYLIIAIILLTIIFSYFVDDAIELLKFISIITTISGYIMIIISYTISIIIKRRINFINISKISNIIIGKGINKGLIMLLIGGIEIIIYIFIRIYNRYIKDNLVSANK